jgi:hypothetical protein
MPRPRLTPTDEQRRLVKNLAAMGNLQQDIAMMIGIRSPKTLRKYFRLELDRGATEANSNVAQTMYMMATDGKHVGAAAFWLKCRAGWRERSAFEPRPSKPEAQPLPLIVEVPVSPGGEFDSTNKVDQTTVQLKTASTLKRSEDAGPKSSLGSDQND